MSDSNRYSKFVEHPRYGYGPRFTGLNPQMTCLHRHSPTHRRVPRTAVAADLSRQTPATVAVTHYYDIERRCRDCGSDFIFFALEQKHWYEELQFSLDADCVRCFPCRKRQQGISRTRQICEDLFHLENRSVDQSLAMAECCLDLIEAKVFAAKQCQQVRMLLNRVAGSQQVLDRATEIRKRLQDIESVDRN